MAERQRSLFPELNQGDEGAAPPARRENWRIKDRRGEKFGLLTVIAATDERKHSFVVWRCRCECGGEALADTGSLVGGGRVHCGSKVHPNGGQFKPADLTGRRSGKLVAIERTSVRNGAHWVWRCRCDCGNEINVSTAYLWGKPSKRGGLKSCGCMKSGRPPSLGNSGLRSCLSSYKRQAKRRGFEWGLNAVQFYKLVKGHCAYCGELPSKKIKVPRARGIRTIAFIANGIDRVDNSQGYVLGNCVSCCSQCNIAKRTLKVDDFKAWVKRAYEHMFGDDSGQRRLSDQGAAGPGEIPPKPS